MGEKNIDISAYSTNIGNKIKAYIKEKHLSQEKIGKTLGMSPSTINSLAQGDRDPRLSTLIAIADLLGTSLDQLTGYTIELKSVPEDEYHAREAVERMDASLDHLSRTLSEMADLKKNNNDITEIVNYVQRCIKLIRNKEPLKGEEDL